MASTECIITDIESQQRDNFGHSTEGVTLCQQEMFHQATTRGNKC